MSRSTVTSTLKALKSMGYVDYGALQPRPPDRSGDAHRAGYRPPAHRHSGIFQHILQLEPNVSNDVACELEHVIPPDVIRRLGQFVLYLRSREDDWKNWQEDYKEIRLEHIQSNTDRDLVRNAPPHARHAHPDDGAGRTAEKVPLAGFILRVGRALRRREKPCKTFEANALRVASPSAGKRGNVKAR